MKLDAIRTCWYMRGGISYNDAMLLDFEERTEINNIIKENLDVTKKTGIPFF